MEKIGIICEYNPFHKGHLYHINEIKKMYPDSIIIACISSSFTQRGEVSVLNKWDKTKIALDNNIDLVVELPFIYSTQSADIFAKAALYILNALNVNRIVFGSESDNLNKLINTASVQISNKKFDKTVKKYLDQGNNYPTSLSLALKEFNLEKIESPNDLLGVSYIKEIIKNKYNITPIAIKRTNNYHGKNKGNIKSASEIRNLLKNNKKVNKYITYKPNILYKNTDYFKFLKYQINNNDISNVLDINEGIDSRIKKVINQSNTLEDLIKKVKTKRYTYNKINRIFIHILCNITKDDAKENIDYIRVLGFNENGKQYLNKIKKTINIPIVTKYKDTNSKVLEIEKKATAIYSMITGDTSLIEKEIKKPIYKK